MQLVVKTTIKNDLKKKKTKITQVSLSQQT